jgi:hypothetical protein
MAWQMPLLKPCMSLGCLLAAELLEGPEALPRMYCRAHRPQKEKRKRNDD